MMRAGSDVTGAVVLRRFDYGETSQTGRLFTREHGRVAVLAKGIKRPNPDLRGPMDLFALAEVEVRLRPRSELHLLVRYRVVTGFPGLRRNLERLQAAFYLTEVLREGTRDLDPAPGLFDAAVAALAALETADAPGAALVVAWFELRWLDLAGFAPRFDACVVCDRPAPAGRPVRFSPWLGGLVCRRCHPRRPVRLVTLRVAVRGALAALRTAESPRPAAALHLGRGTRRALRELLPTVLQVTMEKELRAAAFVTPF